MSLIMRIKYHRIFDKIWTGYLRKILISLKLIIKNQHAKISET
jgi:hypothetical protein